jgi:hypothetical protein
MLMRRRRNEEAAQPELDDDCAAAGGGSPAARQPPQPPSQEGSSNTTSPLVCVLRWTSQRRGSAGARAEELVDCVVLLCLCAPHFRYTRTLHSHTWVHLLKHKTPTRQAESPEGSPSRLSTEH